MFLLLATSNFAADVKASSGNARIIHQDFKMSPNGSYEFSFEADDGSFRTEKRHTDGYVSGKYGYIDENGSKKTVTYGSPLEIIQNPYPNQFMTPKDGKIEIERLNEDVSIQTVMKQ